MLGKSIIMLRWYYADGCKEAESDAEARDESTRPFVTPLWPTVTELSSRSRRGWSFADTPTFPDDEARSGPRIARRTDCLAGRICPHCPMQTRQRYFSWNGLPDLPSDPIAARISVPKKLFSLLDKILANKNYFVPLAIT